MRPNACRQPIENHFCGVLLQLLGRLDRGQRVDIHDAIHAIVVILQRDIVLDRAQIVPQMLPARWPGPRKHASLFRHSITSYYLMSLRGVAPRRRDEAISRFEGDCFGSHLHDLPSKSRACASVTLAMTELFSNQVG